MVVFVDVLGGTTASQRLLRENIAPSPLLPIFPGPFSISGFSDSVEEVDKLRGFLYETLVHVFPTHANSSRAPLSGPDRDSKMKTSPLLLEATVKKRPHALRLQSPSDCAATGRDPWFSVADVIDGLLRSVAMCSLLPRE